MQLGKQNLFIEILSRLFRKGKEKTTVKLLPLEDPQGSIEGARISIQLLDIHFQLLITPLLSVSGSMEWSLKNFNILSVS